jgi:hypothetical protein
MCKSFSTQYCVKYFKERSGYFMPKFCLLEKFASSQISRNRPWFVERKYSLLYSISAHFWILSCTRWLQSPFSCPKNKINVNPLTPNDLERRHAVSPLKIKIPCKSISKKPTNKPIIHSVINYVWYLLQVSALHCHYTQMSLWNKNEKYKKLI